jgi:hypothetical protein
MGVDKVILKRGNGTDTPKKHDEVSMEYTGSTDFAHAKEYGSQDLQDGFTTTKRRIRRASSKLHSFSILPVHQCGISDVDG